MRFLALVVFIVEQETSVNASVGLDVLPASERILRHQIQAESDALQRARQAALGEARRSRAQGTR